MTDRSGTLERIGAPVAQPQAPEALASWEKGVLKAFIPWVVVIAIWEMAAANGWSGAVLFPPPSSFLRYALESDFRVGFGGDVMPITVANVVSALRGLVVFALRFGAAISSGVLVS